MDKEYVTVPQVAKAMGLTRFRILQLIKAGIIESRRFGYLYYVEKEYARELVAEFLRFGKYHTFPRVCKNGLKPPPKIKLKKLKLGVVKV